ncbi:hypothetical protein C8J57DRAFT_1253673 [Mycena rebaudengoi]|nr:hypothetical protein C8J57DRAFT_1253673 [Mycena rebaudengoi]
MGKFGVIHLSGGDDPARWSHMAVLSNLTPNVKPSYFSWQMLVSGLLGVDQNLGIKEGGGTDAGVMEGSEPGTEMEKYGGGGEVAQITDIRGTMRGLEDGRRRST